MSTGRCLTIMVACLAGHCLLFGAVTDPECRFTNWNSPVLTSAESNRGMGDRTMDGTSLLHPDWSQHGNNSGYPFRSGRFFAGEILGPGAQPGGLGLYPSISNRLGIEFPASLNGTSGAITGDVTWAFQWDASLPVGDSLHRSLNQSSFLTHVPEPSALMLLSLALVLLGVFVRRRSN